MQTMRHDTRTWLPGLMAAALLVAGCAGTPARAPPAGSAALPVSGDSAAAAPSDPRGSVAQLALSMVGVPYRYGGADPAAGFDCSGLVYYSYTSNGYSVPRTSQAQFDASLKITLAEAAQGDLLFFRDQEKLSHVAIYIGDGRFVHAPSSGGSVHVAEVDAPYYQRHLVAVGRLLR